MVSIQVYCPFPVKHFYQYLLVFLYQKCLNQFCIILKYKIYLCLLFCLLLFFTPLYFVISRHHLMWMCSVCRWCLPLIVHGVPNSAIILYMPLVRWVLVRMIGFISSLVTHSLLVTLTRRQYSAVADIHTFQFTIAHTLGFSLSSSHLLAMDFDTQTTTVSHYKCYT
jgi:hypothetical protein